MTEDESFNKNLSEALNTWAEEAPSGPVYGEVTRRLRKRNLRSQVSFYLSLAACLVATLGAIDVYMSQHPQPQLNQTGTQIAESKSTPSSNSQNPELKNLTHLAQSTGASLSPAHPFVENSFIQGQYPERSFVRDASGTYQKVHELNIKRSSWVDKEKNIRVEFVEPQHRVKLKRVEPY